MLAFQLQQYPFRFGLAEGTDPRQVPPGTLTTAENVVWRQSGRIEKRYAAFGFSRTLAAGGTMSAATRLFARGTDLCIANSTGLYSFGQSGATWRFVGTLPDASPTWTTMIDDSIGVAASDARLYNTYLVQAWVQGDPTASSTTTSTNTLFVRVVDQATGAIAMAPTQLSTASGYMGVRVLTIGNKAYVISRLGSTAPYSIQGFVIDLSSFAVSAHAMKADVSITSVESGWDACVIGSTVVVAYNQTGGNVRLASFDSSLSSLTSATIATGGCEMVSICGTSLIYVLYSASGATPRPVKIATANASTLALISGPTTIETPASGSRALSVSVCEYDSTNCVVAYQIYTGLNELYLATAKVSSLAVVDTTTSRKSAWLTALTRPFMLNSRCYIGVVDTGPPLPSASTFTGYSSAVAEIEFTDNTGSSGVPLRLVGKVDDLVGGKLVTSAPRPEPVISLTGTQALFPLPFQSSVPTSVTNWRCGMRLVSLDVGASRTDDWGRAITIGQESYITGSGLTTYDGSRAFDYGFFRGPQVDSGSTATVGGNMVAGAYLYGAVQEYRSQAGMLHRSPPAIGVSLSVASGTTGAISVIVSGYSFTNKQGLIPGFCGSFPVAPTPTLLPIYRSTVGGSTYQRLSYEPTYNLFEADATQTFATYADTAADADITAGTGPTAIPLAARPAIYTTGGILDDEQPPSNITHFHHVDRLFVLAGDQRSWWYSKAFQDDSGTVPGFSATFRILFDEAQVAGATLDDKAIFYSATGIRYMYGQGPSAAGLSNDFTTPTPIQTDVGCTNARSLVSTPDGHMFLSARGIYLLTRKLETVWIGRPVRATLEAYPDVTSAVLLASSNQVRFTCNAADGLSGVVIVYDYVEKQWSTFKYTDTNTGTYGCPIADACMWLGSWTFVTPTGSVFQETQSSYLDNGTAWVPMTLETAWISSAGPLAFQSVRSFALDGTSNTDHDLTIQVGFDSETAYAQTATFLAQSAVTTVGPEECEITIGTRRKCSQIRFKITDATPTTGTIGTGQGPAFEMMGIEVGAKQGFGNNPATKRA